MRYYHITYENNLKSILEEGLIPNEKENFDYINNNENLQYQDGVYLVTEDKLYFANRMMDTSCGWFCRSRADLLTPYVVLEVEIPDSEKHKISPDKNVDPVSDEVVVYNGVIPSEWITIKPEYSSTIYSKYENSDYDDQFDFMLEYYMSDIHVYHLAQDRFNENMLDDVYGMDFKNYKITFESDYCEHLGKKTTTIELEHDMIEIKGPPPKREIRELILQDIKNNVKYRDVTNNIVEYYQNESSISL